MENFGVADLVNHELSTKIFPTMHQYKYTKNVIGIIMHYTIAYSPNFSLLIAFTCSYGLPKFPSAKYFPCTVYTSYNNLNG